MVESVPEPYWIAIFIEINEDVASNRCAGDVSLCRGQKDDVDVEQLLQQAKHPNQVWTSLTLPRSAALQ
jgi:hypothetical protein